MRTPGSVSTMNAIGLPTTWRPSDSVPDDQWWHSTGRIGRPAASTTIPQVVAGDLVGRDTLVDQHRADSRVAHDRRAGPLRDRGRVAVVVEGRVADQDHIGCLEVVGAQGASGFCERNGSIRMRCVGPTISKLAAPW